MNDEEKKQIEQLLPFYVNESLEDEEIKIVEEALTADKELLEEVLFLQDLQNQVKQPHRDSSPGELGLKRLQKQLKENQQYSQRPVRDNKSNPIEQKLNRWRYMALAACLLLVVQTVLIIEPQDFDSFKAASGQIANQNEGKIISVTFVPGAKELLIRNLLLEVNASITNGPSALGIYRLSIPGDFQLSLNKLKSHADLIESIQEE